MKLRYPHVTFALRIILFRRNGGNLAARNPGDFYLCICRVAEKSPGKSCSCMEPSALSYVASGSVCASAFLVGFAGSGNCMTAGFGSWYFLWDFCAPDTLFH